MLRRCDRRGDHGKWRPHAVIGDSPHSDSLKRSNGNSRSPYPCSTDDRCDSRGCRVHRLLLGCGEFRGAQGARLLRRTPRRDERRTTETACVGRRRIGKTNPVAPCPRSKPMAARDVHWRVPSIAACLLDDGIANAGVGEIRLPRLAWAEGVTASAADLLETAFRRSMCWS